MLQAVRWLSAAARAVLPPNKKRLQEWQEENSEPKLGDGGAWGRMTAGEQLWRARESVLLQAAVTRVPVDVVPNLNDAELEVRGLGYGE